MAEHSYGWTHVDANVAARVYYIVMAEHSYGWTHVDSNVASRV